ncbi:MAG: bifunctional DNA-formamidopyrimidine glycosylase/DNA-(apurinic or apyrimidinic site) lyase [bacterium]
MPELPEVETIRGQLQITLLGKKIIKIEVRRDKSWRGDINQIIGREITKINRVGKYLFFHTDTEVGLIGHLKMTGRMIVENGEFYETAKHTRVVITFDNDKKMYFWDVRVFGYLEVTDDSKLAQERQAKRLGKDPWEITTVEFEKLCNKYKRPVKNIILDQALIAGVGNIYANDALWKAKIDPRKPGNEMTKKQCSALLLSLQQVMERGLVTGGASDNSYVNAYNQKGKYQDEFLVYKKIKQPCLRCGNALKRIVVGGRGSFICEKCQK